MPIFEDINRYVRLRLALLVFSDLGYARLDITTTKPMVMPTAKLLKRMVLTTDVEPLVLRPSQDRLSEPETRKQLQYTQALKSVMAREMANCWFCCKAAANLLAGTNPKDQMRAYAARDSSGEWQVELLPP